MDLASLLSFGVALAVWLESRIVYFAGWVLLWKTLVTLITNYVHKWAHLLRVPAPVR